MHPNEQLPRKERCVRPLLSTVPRMLSKCANPSCHTPFLYLREGKLYQMEVGAEVPASAPQPNNYAGERVDRRPARRLEFFWLCGRCSRQMTLAFDHGHGVTVVPIRSQGAAAF